MKSILCAGCVTTDVIVSPVDALPEPGQLAAVGSTQVHVGGCAANAAIDLAKLGLPATLCAVVGDDSFGRFVEDTARAAGVDVSGLVMKKGVETTSSVVCVDSQGERRFLYNPGSTSAMTVEDVGSAQLERADIVFIAGAMLLTAFDGGPCAGLLRAARAAGKYTVMDTAWDFEGVWLPKVAPSLPYLDVFMPSYGEASRLSGLEDPAEMAEFFIGLGAKSVVIKLGEKGAFFREAGGRSYRIAAYNRVKAVDTTGAGDAFCAGYLCGLAQGWGMEECGAFANAVAAHCVTRIGASAGIRPVEEIRRFMEQAPAGGGELEG